MKKLLIFEKKRYICVRKSTKNNKMEAQILNKTSFSSFLFTQKKEEKKMNKEKRKKNGVFFTNSLATVDKIIAIIDFSTVKNKKILEPACGQGIIILRILDRFYQQYQDKYSMDNFIENSIIFNDLDVEMVEQTKKNIQEIYFNWFNVAYTGLFQSFVSDFTLRNNPNNNTLFQEENAIILDKFYGKIDYVVGNPPYVSLYGRRDKKQNEQQRIDYLRNYMQFPAHLENGKINLVMLFLEHSLDFLKEKTQLSFIIDLAFFETAYQYTRQFLLEKTSIEKLIINITDFDVASGQIILQLSKNQQNKENNVFIYDEKTKQNYTLKQSIWDNPKDEFKFRYSFCDISDEIINKIKNKNDKTILAQYPNKNLRTCTMLLDMEDKFTILKTANSVVNALQSNIYPYYQGAKSLSVKYDKFKFEKYFIYDKPLQDKINDHLRVELDKQGIKNKKRIGLGEAVIYENPKIFIRQSAKELIASLDYTKSASNNSLYVFSLRENNENTIFILKFVCAWLNADLMTFYAQRQNIIRFSEGKQPQIKIADLGTIPLPSDKSLQEKIVFFATQIIDFQIDIEFSKNEINKLVFEYYGLSATEIMHIQKSITDF